MNRKLLPFLSVMFFCTLIIADASAGEPIKCEKRNSPARSKVSVEVEDLKVGAIYTAIIKSGVNSVLSSTAADSLGVIELDFDSNKKDILAGATAISPKFISSNIDVLVTDAMGNVIVETNATCKIK